MGSAETAVSAHLSSKFKKDHNKKRQQRADSLFDQAQKHFNSSDYKAAIDTFQLAVKEEPRNGEAWFNLGITLMASAEREESREKVQEIHGDALIAFFEAHTIASNDKPSEV